MRPSRNHILLCVQYGDNYSEYTVDSIVTTAVGLAQGFLSASRCYHNRMHGLSDGWFVVLVQASLLQA